MSKTAILQGVETDTLGNLTSDVDIKRYAENSVRKQLATAVANKPQKSFDCANYPCTTGVSYSKAKNATESDLEAQIQRLTEKLDLLAKQHGLLGNHDMQKHVHELETQLSSLTNARIHHLEQLQEQQTRWQIQFLNTLEHLHTNNSSIPIKDATNVSHQQSFPHQKQIRCSPTVDYGCDTSFPYKEDKSHFLEKILQSGNPIPKPSPNICCDEQLDLTPVRDYVVPKSETKLTKDLIPVVKTKELEKEQISKCFPTSITEYFFRSPIHVAKTDVLDKIKILPTTATECKTELEKIAQSRFTFDNNLKTIQHSMTNHTNPFKTYDVDVLTRSTDGASYLKHLVNEKIVALSNEILHENDGQLMDQRKFFREKPATKNNQNISKDTHKSKRGRDKQKIHDLETDEYAVTHKFGRAAHHSRRTTVQKPFMHVTTSHKEPKFRMRRAIETVSASYKRSEKSQVTQRDVSPSFYFDSSLNLQPNSITAGNLVPIAVPLKPPTICDTNVIPVLIPQFTASPKKALKVAKPRKTEKENKPLSVLEISKKCVGSLDSDNSIEIVSDNDMDEQNCDIGIQVELNGRAQSDASRCNRGPIDREVKVDLSVKHNPNIFEKEIKEWMEKEILCKILSQIYDNKSDEPKSDVTNDFTLSVDAGNRHNDETMKTLIESEIGELIKNMIGKTQPTTSLYTVSNCMESPKVCVSPVFPTTPVPTPTGSPVNTLSEYSVRLDHARTCKTPESSEMEISLPSSHSKPKIYEMEEKSITNETLSPVSTPEVTPHASLSVLSASVELNQSLNKSLPKKSDTSSTNSLVDPWAGEMIPLQEEICLHPTKKTKDILFPPVLHRGVDANTSVVQIQPEAKESKLALSESSASESTSKGVDATISDGQLVVSHGELKPKHISGDARPDLDDLGTLNGVTDLQDEPEEPSSEGEIVAKQFSKQQFLLNNPQHEDPTGIYERPRKHKHLVSSDEEDLSVGELAPSVSRRQRFFKWKKSRTPSTQPNKECNEDTIGDDTVSSMNDSDIVLVQPANGTK